MSEQLNTGGAAFPLVLPEGEVFDYSAGMSLRDYFAAKCLEHLVDRMDWMHQDAASYLANALQCYTMADAMLEARKD